MLNQETSKFHATYPEIRYPVYAAKNYRTPVEVVDLTVVKNSDRIPRQMSDWHRVGARQR